MTKPWLYWSLGCGAVAAAILLGVATLIGGSAGDTLAVFGASPAALIGAWFGGVYGQSREKR